MVTKLVNGGGDRSQRYDLQHTNEHDPAKANEYRADNEYLLDQASSAPKKDNQGVDPHVTP